MTACTWGQYRKKAWRCLSIVLFVLVCWYSVNGQSKNWRNSIGLEMVTIRPGTFQQGSTDAEYDEKPLHRVTIRNAFTMGSTEITNAQYELFDPGHKRLRGKMNTSFLDDDPVVFVSWNDAVAFCNWLSVKEHTNYRLPTEAEWEYACRAGTTTHYATGDTLPSVYRKGNGNGGMGGYPVATPDPAAAPPNIQTGKTPPNAWGLYDMHGNVEEWCNDWYGPYPANAQVDPAGVKSGDAKVTRGGSHTCEFEFVHDDKDPMKSMHARYLSSSNRSASLIDDRNWLIGFRIVQAKAVDQKKLLQDASAPLFAQHVNMMRRTVSPPAAPNEQVYFEGPIPYVVPPASSTTTAPFFYHNHQPAITALPNGDLLAIWYNTLRESGRELKMMASRKRYGNIAWDTASVFFDVPDRNEHGTAIWWNGGDSIFHFFGYAAGNTWDTLALAMRVSTDNGVHWTAPRFINPEYGAGNQVIASVTRDAANRILFTCDATPRGAGGSVVWISADEGKSWTRPAGIPKTRTYEDGASGNLIAGIHASILSFSNGELYSLGRGDNIKNTEALSRSTDGGKSWNYSASGLFPVASKQRCTIQRLPGDKVFLASFAPSVWSTDKKGVKHVGSGMFAALSEDGGKTFPFIRLVVNEAKPGTYNGWGWQHEFQMTATSAEPFGYLTSTLTSDGRLHLISSGNEYIFNEAWIKGLAD